MFDDAISSGPKLPLDDLEANAVQRLGRWMRVVGTIQLAFSGLLLVIFGLSAACGALIGGGLGLFALLFVAGVAVWLLQALRIQAAGEQFKNLADERDADYVELAFARLKTVYIIDVVIGLLFGLSLIGDLL